MDKKIIDISRHQDTIDFDALKASGIDGVIIKAGGSDDGIYEDSMYRRNVAECERVGIPYGLYYYVGPKCITPKDGVADAERFDKLIKDAGAKPAYPIYIDLESTDPPDKAGATDATIAFCEYMEDHGYFVGIYASDISGFAERLDLSRLDAYTKWVANYNCAPQYVKSYDIWQYTDKGIIPGIKGYVDVNHCYKDFPELIKSKGCNGFPKPATQQAAESKPEPAKPAAQQATTTVTVNIDGVDRPIKEIKIIV